MEPASNRAVDFSLVEAREREAIRDERRKANVENDASLLGLALSGGGIRSATFNLGVLQGLADVGLLRFVDYLSTVSGGGYIGSWLLARLGQKGATLRQVEDDLSPAQSPDNSTPAREPVKFLREYSNYLTPQTGFLSADTWTMVSIWVRNTALIQIVVVLALVALLLLPRLAFFIAAAIMEPANLYYAELTMGVFYVFAFIAIAVGLEKSTTRFAISQAKVRWFIVFPMLTLCWLFAAIVRSEASNGASHWPFASGVGLFAFIGLAVVQLHRQIGGPEKLIYLRFAFYAAVLATAITHGMLGLADALGPLGVVQNIWTVMTFGPIAGIAAASAVGTIYVGLLGRALPDAQREWISRVGAWLTVYGIMTSALFFVAGFGPVIVSLLQAWLGRKISAGLTLGWIASTAAGLAAGWSSKSGNGRKKEQSKLLKFAADYVPYVFTAGLFCVISFAIHLVIVRISYPIGFLQDNIERTFGTWSGLLSQEGVKGLASQHWIVMNPDFSIGVFSYPHVLIMGFLVSALLAWFLSTRFDLNEFSMHHFYKNRLVRCYLGGARAGAEPARHADPFTGFDPADDISLESVVRRPYPLVNTTINLVHGKRLAWQERKANSFTFTPDYCGFDYQPWAGGSTHEDLATSGYRGTEGYGGGLQLGTAMAISGAAVNSNMGSFGSPATAFLMTIFNIRLGWWLGNPRHNKNWQYASPRTGILYLLRELTGETDDDSGFVNLSDGGHFENLGIYELVRRRCSFIIASDGSQDADFAFEDLGNAIRKCRSDFGVEIDLDLAQLRPDDSGLSGAHCAVGTIHYPKTSTKPESTGVLLYIKSSLTGDEPSDLLEYRKLHEGFPHQSTADQWFDESQFESYRRLGYHISQKVFERVGRSGKTRAQSVVLSDLFSRLRQAWFPPCAAVTESFTRHGETFDQLVERMRTSGNLAGLREVFYPDFKGSDKEWDEFLYCNSLLQLMENVYIDLHLEENCGHPDNQGWIAVFKTWWASEAFQKRTWPVVKGTFGDRFAAWCERTLKQ